MNAFKNMWQSFIHRIVPAILLMSVVSACDPNSTGGGRSGGGIANLFGGAGANSRETWTIECNTFEGDKRRETADRFATLLKKVQRIDPKKVWVEHDESASRLFYGEYDLRFKEAQTDGNDQVKGEMIIELSDEIKRDLAYVRELAIGDQYPFFVARPRPKPMPFTGNPEWDLQNANGLYTLNVGVTFPTANMHDYKQAAYLWVEDLRKRGHEAYYYFAPDKAQASICVGTFGPEAFVLDSQGRKGYSPVIKALQGREDFKYNLENGHKVYVWVTNPETRRRERVANYSFLAEIPKRPDITAKPKRY